MSRAHLLRWLTLGLVASLLTACGSSAATSTDAPTIRVVAASDLKFALDEVIARLEKQHPEVQVNVSYGSSGTFLSQIENGAPADVFLSADLSYPRQLVEEGKAEQKDLFPYAVGRLVLWVPEGSAIDPSEGLSVLTDPAVAKVAIANPEHAPYGMAAVAALRQAGLYDKISPKLVLGENISQAAEFVQSGNAGAGLVAKSLVLADTARGVGEWWELPADLYPRLDQGGVVLNDTAAHPGGLLREELLGKSGTAIMARYGFTLPQG